MPYERSVFWLNLMNIGLGIVVLLTALAVAYGAVWELVLRHRKARGLVNRRALEHEAPVSPVTTFAAGSETASCEAARRFVA